MTTQQRNRCFFIQRLGRLGYRLFASFGIPTTISTENARLGPNKLCGLERNPPGRLRGAPASRLRAHPAPLAEDVHVSVHVVVHVSAGARAASSSAPRREALGFLETEGVRRD